MISNEEKMLKERLRSLVSMKGIKVTELAETDSERVMIGRQLKENDTIVPFRTLYKILYAYHDVDANWLMLGEGSWQKTGNLAAPHIYNTKNEVNGSKAGGNINVGTVTIPYPVRALIDEKDKRIAELEKINATLQNVVNAFTAGIRK